MLLTSSSRARRAGSLIASVGVVLAMLLVASPAQAAPIVNLSADDNTITLGQTVTLSWTASDTTTLNAQGDWTGPKAVPNGSEGVTPTEAGTFTYTLVASNGEDDDTSDSVEVTVAPGPITPNAVTFPDPCTVVIPTTPNVTYFVDYGDGDTEELDAGSYDGVEFSGGDEVTFFAEANEDFSLADDAVTSWDYTAPDSCFEVDEGPDLVTTTVACRSVTFTNTTDGPLDILYGSFEEDDADGELTLAAGASRKVSTNRPDFGFIASADLDGDSPVQIRELEVPQTCDDGGTDNGTDDNSGSGHPTVAPAAGVAAR